MASRDGISRKRGRYCEYLLDSSKMPNKVRREVELLIADEVKLCHSTSPPKGEGREEYDINLLEWLHDSSSDISSNDHDLEREKEAQRCSDDEAYFLRVCQIVGSPFCLDFLQMTFMKVMPMRMLKKSMTIILMLMRGMVQKT
jgi:hypothetical protein